MRQTTCELEERRVLQWLVSEYQRQARAPRTLEEIEAALRLKRGRLQQLLDEGELLHGTVTLTSGRDGLRIALKGQGYADALNLLATLPARH